MARPYLLFGAQEVNRVIDTLTPVVTDWSSRWFIDDAISLACVPMDHTSHSGEPWLYAKSEDSMGVYLHKPPGLFKALTLACCGDVAKTAGLGDAPSPLVNDCLQDALSDLASHCMSSLLQGNPPLVRLIQQAPAEEIFAAGSGTLLLRLISTSLALELIVPGTLAARFLRAKPATKSGVATATIENPVPLLRNRSIKVSALLGHAEIDIGTLQSIQPGDVIRFDARIDQPATLVTTQGTKLATGYLGSREQFKSLLLSR